MTTVYIHIFNFKIYLNGLKESSDDMKDIINSLYLLIILNSTIYKKITIRFC
jgi:hypothetical protein